MLSSLFLQFWIHWVLLYETDQLVPEPRGRWSRWGVLRATREEAADVRLSTAELVARRHVAELIQRYPLLVRYNPSLAVQVVDMAYNSGWETSAALYDASPLTFRDARIRFYTNLARRPDYEVYLQGWVSRVQRLDRDMLEALSE